jgi:uncharacterized DUF497 family protein
MSFDFEWNNKKSIQNRKKHQVSFEEALTVFDDPNYLLFYDPHADEERFIASGYSSQAQLLTVIHCYRENTIRLISARKATQQEKNNYEKRI